MLQIIFKETTIVFEFVWQALNFIWVFFIAFWNWLHHVSPPILKSNPFLAQLGFFFASLFFLPFPWWVSFVFIFLPPIWAVFLLIVFYLMFISSFASSIVFM